jgi:hypothetical protein
MPCTTPALKCKLLTLHAVAEVPLLALSCDYVGVLSFFMQLRV